VPDAPAGPTIWPTLFQTAPDQTYRSPFDETI